MGLIVVDASALVELVRDGRHASPLIHADSTHAPDCVFAEFLSSMRKAHRHRGLSAHRVAALLDWLHEAPIEAHPTREMLSLAWALRDRCSAYDAMYVVLARGLDCPLLTADARLARGVEDLCEVRLMQSG
jgi:predicted nucleic acid-binding protein